MTASKSKRDWMKVGWVLVFIVAVVIAINGLALLLTGAETDTQLFQSQTGTSWSAFASSGQGMAAYVEGDLRILGAVTTLLGVTYAMMVYLAFRKGERWALYLLLVGVLGLVYVTADVYLAGGYTWPIYLILIVVDLVGLLLPFRTFFPRQADIAR
jgi:Na+/alanine symporter